MHRLLPLLFPLTIACGPIPQLGDYDQSCEVDTDCAVVFLHRDCDCASIGAVNTSELDRVNADNDAARAQEWCPTGAIACDVAPMEAYCAQGTCRSRVDESFYSYNNPAEDTDMSQDMSALDSSE